MDALEQCWQDAEQAVSSPDSAWAMLLPKSRHCHCLLGFSEVLSRVGNLVGPSALPCFEQSSARLAAAQGLTL